jgi:hypothetical protein
MAALSCIMGGAFPPEERRSVRTKTRRVVGAVVLLLLASHVLTPAVAGSGVNCSNTSTPHTPLSDLKNGSFHGFKGGLYPHGRNVMPRFYRRIGINRAATVQPLEPNGQAGPNGQIVLMSVGMSNAFLEWEEFSTEVDGVAGIAPELSIVQGAESGQDAVAIADADAAYWTHVDEALGAHGLTPKQVQVIWLKEAIAYETRAFPADARRLRNLLDDIIAILKDRFQNLKIVYLSSRTYGGYATDTLGPEPFAYHSGFAVKWQIAHDIHTPRREHPWIGWGPYLWTNGTVGRSDGLVWTCHDVQDDGVHPSEDGQQKVADLLIAHFTTNPTAKHWFL